MGSGEGDCYKKSLFTLDHFLDFINNFRVSQCHDIANITFIGDGTEHPPHDLAGTGLGHIRHNPDLARPGNLADIRTNLLGNLLGKLIEKLQTRVSGKHRDQAPCP